ncbi:MAG: YhbY family RNA-binding protein [Candidatus Thalassarchaeaceae archaeon]|jgi:RNA-binding protein YhbY|nr:YhbY family RNA-binding protein [Candidatus Thalassarchaeaceae archaeon]|tara:strand:- start:1971 stop:2240 length:270 start_codon:yes stop_codon:yes gene_type:complete
MNEADKRLKKMALNPTLEVTIRVGKSGLTESLISELDAQLKSRKLVKAKVNRSLSNDSADRLQLWQMLADSTSSNLIITRGNIAVFHRK